MSRGKEACRPIGTTHPRSRLVSPQGIACLLLIAAGSTGIDLVRADSFSVAVSRVQPAVVKIYGSGGLSGLEAYQSGLLIRADGYVLTAWSYVLDSGTVAVVLHDGRRYEGTIVGADPRAEVAVLKIDATELPFLSLEEAVNAEPGERVLAFSNLYGIAQGDEPVSVLHGIVAGVTDLTARRGAYATAYDGKAYVLDAMTNNAGAAGGVLTNLEGQLLAVLGKELRDAQTNIWLNYAIPASEIQHSVEDIVNGKLITATADELARRPERATSLAALGIVLVPNVLASTPPYVDFVLPDSSAQRAGLRGDDLIISVGSQMVRSQDQILAELGRIEFFDPVTITIIRQQRLLEIVLPAPEPAAVK